MKTFPIFKEKVKAGKAQNKHDKNKVGAPRKVWNEKALEGRNPEGEEGSDKRDLSKDRNSLTDVKELEKLDHSTNNN